MIVAVLTIELFFGEADSLKEKRRCLKSLLERLKARFNISCAEVGRYDAWQRSTLGIASVSNEKNHIDKTITEIKKFIEQQVKAEILEVHMEIL